MLLKKLISNDLFWKKWYALTIRGAQVVRDRKKVGNPWTRQWDSLRYFWRPTGRLAGTKREFGKNAVLSPGLSGFKPHRRMKSLPWNTTKRNYDKGWNPSTITAVHRSDVGWIFRSLIAKLIVDYDEISDVIDYISFLVSSIDYDYSKNCNRLRLPRVCCQYTHPVELKDWVHHVRKSRDDQRCDWWSAKMNNFFQQNGLVEWRWLAVHRRRLFYT